MYARTVMFTLGPGTRNTVEIVKDQIAQALKSRKGLVKVYFVGDDETGKYGAVVFWKTKEDGETAFRDVNPTLAKALGGLLEGPPQSDYFKVMDIVEPDA